MATYKYNLKDSKAKKETPLYLVIRFDYMRVKYYINEKVQPRYWDQKNQRAKNSLEGHTELNTRLDNIKTKAQTICRRLINDEQRLTPALVSQELEIHLRPITHPNTRRAGRRVKTFIEFFNKFIEERGNRVRPNTIKKYKTTLKHIEAFAKAKNRQIDFNDITIEFYHDFLDYLYNDLDLNTNSAGKYIRVLITVLGEATERGLNNNLAFKKKAFKAVSEPVAKVWLDQEEIDKIYKLDLSATPGHERVRDLFIIECMLGLRFSDMAKFNPEEHIVQTEKGPIISIIATKTNQPVSIPLHYQAKAIIDKYSGQLPPTIENQPTNRYLKEICKKAKINKTFTKKRPKAGKVTEEKVPKYSLITTHTARRSFATNMINAGFSSSMVMALTGHKTESAFLRYVGSGSQEHALNLADHKYFTGVDKPQEAPTTALRVAK